MKLTLPTALAGLTLAAAFTTSVAMATEWSYYDGAYHRLDEGAGEAFPSDAYGPAPTNDTNAFEPGAKDDQTALEAYSPIPPQTVALNGHQPGEIVINTEAKRLYFVLEDGRSAIAYGIGVGKQGFAWKGVEHVSRKREWPDWTPPAEMIARRPDLPGHMDGGLNNPLGARALYLGSTLYRIHGTNDPSTIGHAVSSGCIRLANRDIIDLFSRTSVGAKVTVE